jgi:hypothetical protein
MSECFEARALRLQPVAPPQRKAKGTQDPCEEVQQAKWCAHKAEHIILETSEENFSSEMQVGVKVRNRTPV